MLAFTSDVARTCAGGTEIHGQMGSGATFGCIKCRIKGQHLGPGRMVVSRGGMCSISKHNADMMFA